MLGDILHADPNTHIKLATWPTPWIRVIALGKCIDSQGDTSKISLRER
jgi:hypothetical protein